MILDFFADLNWLAVIVAALAYFVLGAIWYSNALFGKQYRAAVGASDEGGMEASALITNAIGWFVAALALALISKGIGADSFLDGLVLGLVVWIGFIGTNRVVAMMYEKSGTALARINGPYNGLGYAIMGIILAVWQ